MTQKMDYLTFIRAGIRNRPGRNIATVVCFAIIAANFFCAQYLMTGVDGSIDQGISRMGADILVVPAQYTAAHLAQRLGPENTVAIVRADATSSLAGPGPTAGVRCVTGVAQASPQLYVATLPLPALSSQPVEIFGIDPATDFTIRPWLKSALPHTQASGEVIVGNAIQAGTGTQISFAGRTWTVVGRLDPTRTAIDRTLFLTMADAYEVAGTESIAASGASRIAPGDVTAILVKVEPGADAGMVGALIMQPSAAITVIARHFTLNPVADEVRALPGIFALLSLVIVIAAFPLVAIIASMVAHERQREIGFMKAIGARRSTIMSLVMAESLVLSAAGAILGIGVSILILTLMQALGLIDRLIGLSIQLPTIPATGQIAVTVLLVILAIGGIASLVPAYRCSTMNAWDSIRTEG